METIIIELEIESKRDAEKFFSENDVKYQIIDNKRFDSGGDIFSIIVGISSISLPLLVKYLIEGIKAKKHIQIKYKGSVIKGISEKNALKIFKNILENES